MKDKKDKEELEKKSLAKNMIAQQQENIENLQNDNMKIHTDGPTVQAGKSKVQDVNRALPQGGNPTGRGQSQHNSVSGGKSLQGNNARSNPPSDKNHN